MAKERKLWSEIDGEPWLDNPRRRKGRKRGRRRRKASAVAVNAPRKRRGRRRGIRANPIARRRRGRRRGFLRNPMSSFSTRGLLGRAMDGAKGGLAVLAGEAAATAIPKLIPIPMLQSGIPALVAEALAAMLTAPLISKMVGPKWAQVYLYGGFSRPLKGIVIGLNVPVVSAALAAYPGGTLNALPAGRSLSANFDASTLEAEEAFVM